MHIINRNNDLGYDNISSDYYWNRMSSGLTVYVENDMIFTTKS